MRYNVKRNRVCSFDMQKLLSIREIVQPGKKKKIMWFTNSFMQPFFFLWKTKVYILRRLHTAPYHTTTCWTPKMTPKTQWKNQISQIHEWFSINQLIWFTSHTTQFIHEIRQIMFFSWIQYGQSGSSVNSSRTVTACVFLFWSTTDHYDRSLNNLLKKLTQKPIKKAVWNYTKLKITFFWSG